MSHFRMFLAVAFIVAVQISTASPQGATKPGDVSKTNDLAILGNPFADLCVSGNCADGKGRKEYDNGDTYEGDFVGGKRKGQGTYTFKNGQVYVGGFSDGLRNGKGKFTFSNGNVYDGSFINDNFIGQGIYTKKSSSSHSGKFTIGEIVDLQFQYVDTYWGKAEIVDILGDKYKVRDLRTRVVEVVAAQKLRPFTEPVKFEIGQNVEVMDKGVWYKASILANEVEYNDHYRIRFDGGNSSDRSENVAFIRPGIGFSTAHISTEKEKCVSGNCSNGFGKYYYANGMVYEGNYVKGLPSGRGKAVYVSGAIYEGVFVDGKRSHGTLTFKSGSVYVGQFGATGFNGSGKMTYSNGDTYDGTWANDNRSGQGTQTLKQSGEVYVGQFASDKRNGKGKVTYKNGDSYDGDWVNGLREGQATYTLANGSYYIGGFLKDKQHGLGKQFNKLTGRMTEGNWNNGVFENTPGVAKITPVADAGPKSPVVETKTLLRETLNGKFDYMERAPLKYIYTNKKTGEVLRYQIEFIDDGGNFAFRWKESTKNEQSGKLVITDEAIRTSTKYINFFSTKTAIAADKEIAFILSQNLHKAVKNKEEISLDLGGGVKRLSYIMQFTASGGTYTDKNIKVLHYKANDDITKVQILDDPICPLIVKIETAEYTLTLVGG